MQKASRPNGGVALELRGGFQRHLARFSVYWVDLVAGAKCICTCAAAFERAAFSLSVFGFQCRPHTRRARRRHRGRAPGNASNSITGTSSIDRNSAQTPAQSVGGGALATPRPGCESNRTVTILGSTVIVIRDRSKLATHNTPVPFPISPGPRSRDSMIAAGQKCGDSCDKRVPLAAFKEDSDGAGLRQARQPSRNACRSVGCVRSIVACRGD